MYLDPQCPGVEDILDTIVAGVRSACTYSGAATLAEFQRKALVGFQSAAGFREGQPMTTSW
jgi:IMP dehydrogenase